jgi:hypothetical protein
MNCVAYDNLHYYSFYWYTMLLTNNRLPILRHNYISVFIDWVKIFRIQEARS